MGQVGGDTWGVHDIVKGEVVDERARLEEEREWLANTARGTCDDCSMGQRFVSMDIVTILPIVELVMAKWWSVFVDACPALTCFDHVGACSG